MMSTLQHTIFRWSDIVSFLFPRPIGCAHNALMAVVCVRPSVCHKSRTEEHRKLKFAGRKPESP